MPLPELEAFLRRLMEDRDYCRRFLTAPDEAVKDSQMNSAEQWAAIEARYEGGDSDAEFLHVLRTRMALIGVEMGLPPAGLTVFHCR